MKQVNFTESTKMYFTALKKLTDGPSENHHEVSKFSVVRTIKIYEIKHTK